jgi:mannose-6-phosphate isomerase-like protein (cupin superfamily)
MDKVNLAEKLDLFDEHWQPKIVARINDHEVRIAKVQGEFVWHKHDDTDDFFLVLEGRLTIHLRDRNIDLEEGELFVVPRGVEHCPRADEEAATLRSTSWSDTFAGSPCANAVSSAQARA